MEFLLSCGAEIDATEDNGRTALIAATIGGHGKSLVVLLRNDVNLNKPDADNMYPVSFAVKYQWSECTRLLISYGANPNQDSSAGTPLAMLCVMMCGDPQVKKDMCLF